MSIDLQDADLLAPAGGHARLMYHAGMTHEQAYDLVAERAARPEFQAVIQQFQATPDGRALLAQARTYWDREGLPVPWDNVLELPVRSGDG
ncbi:MAG: hypothetical protein H0X37_25200 [Herpetosiphonaceae bacterium]|nr:hypothetical protein [Herpetosiphonaceae bacterium]